MSNSVAVLQARTNSSRLPAKVLLPINGIPLVVLAAKRAGNTGRKVIVATSQESSDDALAAVLEQHELECFRGSLDNTLERIVKALDGYADETIVFRLTADNVFPDGALLDEIEEDFLEKKLGYLCCNGVQSGLPYGFSAEIMYLRSLREALKSTTNTYDQEHVTPYIIRKYGENYFQKYKKLKKGNYRSTVDCIEDYLATQIVFKKVNNPVSVSGFDLIKELDNTEYAPAAISPVSKMVLGAVQLGLEYGIANQIGKPSQQESNQLIKHAISNGVQYIDTAQAYGNSERVIGKALTQGWKDRVKVITKLSPLESCSDNESSDKVTALVDLSVYQSCVNLEVNTIDVLMLHDASHFLKWGGSVWQRLIELRKSLLIKELGVSVQSPEELQQALLIDEISFIQMPFNILDWRWSALLPDIKKAKSSRKLVIHARSALLQGLLPSSEISHWLQANVNKNDQKKIKSWIIDQVSQYKKNNIVDLCLNYVESLDWIDGIVVGVESKEQLVENIRTFDQPVLSQSEINAIESSRPILDESTLNPSKWKSCNE